MNAFYRITALVFCGLVSLSINARDNNSAWGLGTVAGFYAYPDERMMAGQSTRVMGSSMVARGQIRKHYVWAAPSMARGHTRAYPDEADDRHYKADLHMTEQHHADYAIQVGAYRMLSKATGLRSKLAGMGFAVYASRPMKGQGVFRLFVSPTSTHADANSVLPRVKQAVTDAFVRRLGSPLEPVEP